MPNTDQRDAGRRLFLFLDTALGTQWVNHDAVIDQLCASNAIKAEKKSKEWRITVNDIHAVLSNSGSAMVLDQQALALRSYGEARNMGNKNAEYMYMLDSAGQTHRLLYLVQCDERSSGFKITLWPAPKAADSRAVTIRMSMSASSNSLAHADYKRRARRAAEKGMRAVETGSF
ncbi:putative zinc-binding dehydrogenase family oxidoreductase [Pseudohyphozyma bogoriensis]|nr:putative zinc-binding dehydrogenase family oxidoreductase [Pseudohyphozyma bogoriensis]